MKHLEPLMTHWLPFFTAVVFMPETSEPASGSVRQKEASLGSSVSIPRYFFLRSSEAATMRGAEARPLQLSDVPMPEQPQPISSSMRQPVRKSRPGPPYSSGTWVFMRPTSHALLMTSCGQVPSLSYSQATGRISFSAKLCANSRMSFCSSVSEKSTTGAPCSQRGRAAASPEVRRRLIDSSVNAHGKGTRSRRKKRRFRSGSGIVRWAAGSGRRTVPPPATCDPRPATPSEQQPHHQVHPETDRRHRQKDEAELVRVHRRPARGHPPAAEAAPHA